MKKHFFLVAQDKGGQGKSHFTANLAAWLDSLSPETPWSLAEIEQRLEFTLPRYFGTQNRVTRVGLALRDPETQRMVPTLQPLDDRLFGLIETGHNIIAECGASTFALFSVWMRDHLAYKPFLRAGYGFTIFVVCEARDPEAADFFNSNFEFMQKLAQGRVILVKNLRNGSDFSLLRGDPIRSIELLRADPPLSEDFFHGEQRRTLAAAASDETLCYRSRLDAEMLHDHLNTQLQTQLKDILP